MYYLFNLMEYSVLIPITRSQSTCPEHLSDQTRCKPNMLLIIGCCATHAKCTEDTKCTMPNYTTRGVRFSFFRMFMCARAHTIQHSGYLLRQVENADLKKWSRYPNFKRAHIFQRLGPALFCCWTTL